MPERPAYRKFVARVNCDLRDTGGRNCRAAPANPKILHEIRIKFRKHTTGKRRSNESNTNYLRRVSDHGFAFGASFHFCLFVPFWVGTTWFCADGADFISATE